MDCGQACRLSKDRGSNPCSAIVLFLLLPSVVVVCIVHVPVAIASSDSICLCQKVGRVIDNRRPTSAADGSCITFSFYAQRLPRSFIEFDCSVPVQFDCMTLFAWHQRVSALSGFTIPRAHRVRLPGSDGRSDQRMSCAGSRPILRRAQEGCDWLSTFEMG